MSIDAKLSQVYTNHCTRATASKTLSNARFDRSDIIKVTGHKDTRSLDTYIGEASSDKKRALSDSLSELVCNKRSHPNPQQVVTVNDSFGKCRVSPVSDTQVVEPREVAAINIGSEGNSTICEDTVSIDLDDNEQNVIFESHHNFQEEFEMNFIKSSEGPSNKQVQKSFTFKNCVFKGAQF